MSAVAALAQPPALADVAARDPSGRRRGLAIVAVAVLGAISTAVVAIIFAQADARVEDARFRELARDCAQAIRESLAKVPDVLTVLRAHLEVSEQPLTRIEFARYAHTVHETLALGLRETAWAPHVTAAERDAFEQAARGQTGLAEFEIRERDSAGKLLRAGDRAEYLPVLFNEALDAPARIFGFDLLSEARRRQALTSARASGTAAATSPFHLNLLKPTDGSGFMAFMPVYGGGTGVQALRGVLIAIVEADKLVARVLENRPEQQDLDVFLFDPDEPFGERMISRHPSRLRPVSDPPLTEADLRALPHVEARLQVADRQWGLLLARPAAGLADDFNGRGLAATIIGLLATLGAVAYLTSTLHHALRLEALTAELRRTGADLRSKGEQVAHLAHHDALTGLPNRVTLREKLQAALDRSQHAPAAAPRPGVMCLDLDRFKAVNDTFGHPVGDSLLVLVAARLRGCLRNDDIVARIGGDEFVILLHGSDAEGAATLAQRLLDVIGQPFEIRGHHISIGLSIGVAFPPAGSTDADLLIRNADFALYRAKQAGRDTWRSFEPDMEAAAQTRRLLEANLRQAVAETAFTLNYQPVIRLSDQRICGFEALLRWNCPGIGPVSPAEFVPLAEECGLIVQIGRWVLQAACLEAARWPEEVRVAVNLSSAQFASPDLVATVEGALTAAGLTPARLELEITETLLLLDSSKVMATLQALKDLGISIAMDDFGTGYSSLSYLQKFPFDTLKIDKSFVRDLPTREDARAIVHAVAGLCRTLGIATIAEGVETAEQLRCVHAEGCDRVQGYYFSRPVPAEQAVALLVERRQLAAA